MHPATPSLVSPGQPVVPPCGNGDAASTPPANASQPLLYQACRDGDTTVVKRLLSAGGVEVNAIDPETRLTPLMLAARHGHDDVALVLLKGQQGASVNLQNSRGDTALSLAAGAGRDDVVELLLFKKARLNQANHNGRTPLAEAAAAGHLKTAELLIALSAQVNAGAKNGEPPLIAAARRGDSALVELLLEKKVDTTLTDRYGWTAFNHAACNGHETLASQLRGVNTATSTAPPPSMAVVSSASTVLQCEAGMEGARAAPEAHTTAQDAMTTIATAKATTMPAVPSVNTVPLATATVSIAMATVSVTAPTFTKPAMPANPVTHLPAATLATSRNPPSLPALPAWRSTLENCDPKACKALLASVGNAANIDAWLRQAAADGHLAAVRLLLEAGANPDGFDDVEGKRGGIPGYHGRQPPRKGHLLREFSGYPDDKRTWNPYAEKEWAQSLALTRAVRKGHADIVQLLLAAGARVDRGSFCQQLLREAVDSGCDDIAQMLLDARRKAPKTGGDDCSAEDMENALDRSISRGNNTLLQTLLETEAGREAARSTCMLGQAVAGKNLAAVRMLLAAGADPMSYRGLPPTTDAIRSGTMEILKALVDAGGDLSSDWSYRDKCPLVAAVLRGDADMVKFVMAQGVQRNNKGAYSRGINEALRVACSRDSVAIVQLLLDAGADPDYTDSYYSDSAFYCAAGAGQADIVALLLKRGAKVNAPTAARYPSPSEGKTALIFAAERAVRAARWSSDGDTVRTVSLLLQAGADVNARGYRGRSALICAAGRGNTEVVRLLLAAGAHREHKEFFEGRNALDFAIEGKHAETVELLRTWNASAS